MLCFGIVQAYCQSISKEQGIKSIWIPKITWQFWGFNDLKKLSLGVILQHDNTTQYQSKKITVNVASLSWSAFLHPAYSPGLESSDYHLFLKLKQFLENRRSANEEELNATVLKWFQIVGTRFYVDGMNKDFILPKTYQSERRLCRKIKTIV